MVDNQNVSLEGTIRILANTPIINATLKLVRSFSYQHFKSACYYRDEAISIQSQHSKGEYGDFFEELRSHVSASIILIVASSEALINEIFLDPQEKLRMSISNFEKEYWDIIDWMPIYEKYQEALSRLSCKKFNEDDKCYSQFRALVHLRNALTHFTPNWDPLRPKEISLIDRLNGKFELSPFVGEGNDFIYMRCMSSSCAKWAVETMIAFIKEFQERSGVSKSKISMFLNSEML